MIEERRIPVEALRDLSSSAITSVRRATDDLLSVCEVIDGLDPSLLSLEKSAGLHQRASTLRSQATHALAASSALSAAAASYELLAQVVDHSLSVPPVGAPLLAKAKKSPRSRKR
jgi:hypothetical protein